MPHANNRFPWVTKSSLLTTLLAIIALPAQAQFNTITTVDDGGGNDVGMYSSIAIGSDDLPIISYFDDSAAALKVAHCNDRACATPATINTLDDTAAIEGRYGAIAIGNDGLPVISYQGGTGNLKVVKCSDLACALPATITDVVDPPGLGATYTSIAIGNGGRPVISYTTDGLNVARCANPECTGVATVTNVDASSLLMGFHTSIAIGEDGLPILSYIDLVDDLLKTVKCGNSACSGGNIITEIDNDASSQQTAIAIRSDGIPFIAYQENIFHSLKVVQCGNTSCNAASSSIIVPNVLSENLGSHADIAFGVGDRAYISHYNVTRRSLMVSVCLTSTCTEGSISMTLDSAAPGAFALGQYTSIAIGVDNLPIISYYDSEADALKVVQCATRACDGLFRGDFEGP